jgi:hypothetical protein
MASFNVGTPQLLGFGLGVQSKSWQELLASKMYDETGDKSLRSARWWVPGLNYWNTDLIDKLNKLSTAELLPGADLVTYMAANAGVSNAVAYSFQKNIAEYRGTEEPGAIETATTIVRDVAVAVGKTAKGLGEGIEGTAKTLPVVLGLLAVGVAGYLIYSGKKGVKLTP